MSPKILRRCTVCGKFHASYLVLDHDIEKGYYCYACWKSRQASFPSEHSEQDKKPAGEPIDTEPSHGSQVEPAGR